MCPFSAGFPGRMKSGFTSRFQAHALSAFEVNSVPKSTVVDIGNLLTATQISGARRRPGPIVTFLAIRAFVVCSSSQSGPVLRTIVGAVDSGSGARLSSRGALVVHRTDYARGFTRSTGRGEKAVYADAVNLGRGTKYERRFAR